MSVITEELSLTALCVWEEMRSTIGHQQCLRAPAGSALSGTDRGGKKIVKAKITEMPRSFCDRMPKVIATCAKSASTGRSNVLKTHFHRSQSLH